MCANFHVNVVQCARNTYCFKATFLGGMICQILINGSETGTICVLQDLKLRMDGNADGIKVEISSVTVSQTGRFFAIIIR